MKEEKNGEEKWMAREREERVNRGGERGTARREGEDHVKGDER